VNGLNGALLSHNPNLSNPQRLGPTQALTCDQDHGYTAEQKAFDQGLMDQFVQNTGRGLTLQQCLTKVGNAAPATGTSPNYAVMDYFDGNTVTGLWNYAQHFAMSDNAYNTGFGPSTPGALEVAAGTTYGATCGDPADTYGPVPECAATTAAATPGVIHPAGPGTVYSDDDPTYDACSSTKDPRIGMAGRNIGDLLNATGTTWGWFQGGFRPSTRNSTVDPVCASAHDNIGGKSVRDYVPHREPFQYYPQTANPRHLQPTSAAAVGLTDQANHQYDLSDFWAAAQTGHMPAVSYLKAGDYQSGHAGSSDPLDEQHFLVNTINQLQRMPTWSSTAVVITYDDSDGWYDHQLGPILNQSQTPLDALSGPGQCGTNPAKVPSTDSGAPEQARCGFGPRVPFLVISPYARANFVSSHLIDQSSVVRFIEDNWSLGRLGNGSADALAGSITSMFDFTRCQGPAVCPRRRTGNLPTGGHEFSPVAASRSPGGDSGEGLHPLAGGGLSKTHAVALGDAEMGVVQEAINSGGGNGLGHDLVEARRVKVGRNGQSPLLIGGINQAVEPLGGIGGHRQQPDVVDHDELGAKDAPDGLGHRVIRPVSSHQDAQGLEAEPGHPPAGVDGGLAQGLQEHRLARARGATDHQVLLPSDPLHGPKRILGGRGDGRQGRIPNLEGLAGGKGGRWSAGGGGGAVAAGHLLGHEDPEYLGRRPALRFGRGQHLGGSPADMGQAHAPQQGLEFGVQGRSGGGSCRHRPKPSQRAVPAWRLWSSLAERISWPSTTRPSNHRLFLAPTVGKLIPGRSAR